MTQKRKFPKWLGITLAVIFLISMIVGYKAYQIFLGASVTDSQKYLYVHTNDIYENVLRRIRTENIVKDADEFDMVAKAMKYPSSVKPGRYKLTENMSNRTLIGNLRGGYQDPVSRLSK